tara:strand:- start:890 stop:2020 length:1131 start_codon:yes stop_codon:yes gene_type:complete
MEPHIFEGYKVKNNVIFGDDDKLFLFQGAHAQFDYLCGKKEVSIYSIEEFNSNIKKRRAFCLDRGKDYLHVIFPCKPIIYQNNFNNLSFKPIYSDKHQSEGVLYPLNYLNFESSYYKNDTHCSPKGSWECLTAIFKELSLEHQEEPLFKSEVRASGDLAVMIDETERSEEIEVFCGLKDRNIRSIREFSNQTMVQRNNGVIKILTNSFPVFDKRVLIFGDSFFGGNLLAMLSEFFKEVIYVRTPYFQSDLVPFIDPDIVLTGQAERYLTSGLSDNNILPIFSEYIFSGYDNSKIDDSFNKALKAILSPKGGAVYNHWRNSFVGNSLRNKALSLKKSNLRLALDLINLASQALQGNDKINSIRDSIKSEYEYSVIDK